MQQGEAEAEPCIARVHDAHAVQPGAVQHVQTGQRRVQRARTPQCSQRGRGGGGGGGRHGPAVQRQRGRARIRACRTRTARASTAQQRAH